MLYLILALIIIILIEAIVIVVLALILKNIRKRQSNDEPRLRRLYELAKTQNQRKKEVEDKVEKAHSITDLINIYNEL
jgi:hypothetical protein